MQFGRRLQYDTKASKDGSKPPPVALDAPGWICSRDLDHFREAAQA
jgi:hypothetical protein